jgi:hypothetical protein
MAWVFRRLLLGVSLIVMASGVLQGKANFSGALVGSVP